MEKLKERMSLWVFGFIFFYFLLTIIDCTPRLLAQYTTIDVSNLARNFSLPLEIFGWALCLIVAGYAGIDRGMLINKSAMMEVGQCDLGHPERVVQMIFALLLLFVEGVILNLFIGEEYVQVMENNGEYYKLVFKGASVPMDGISTALAATWTIYVYGNKAIKGTKDMHKESKYEKEVDNNSD